MKTLLVALGAVLAAPAFAQTEVVPAPTKPTLWLIGDSTVNNGTKGLMGWGTALPNLFNTDKITIQNRARGGRSSRTFYTEGLWQKVETELKPGDFVLMQFGHNDGGSVEGSKATGRASIKGNGDDTQTVTLKDGSTEVVHSFGWYLRQYIEGAKAKGTTPIVLSLVPRNDWKDGKVGRGDTGYGLFSKQSAEQDGADFVDLNGIVADHYDALGEDKVKAFFPFEHTHTSEDGAKLNSQSVVEGLRALPDDPFATYVK